MNDTDTSQTNVSPMDAEEPHRSSRSRSWAERLRPRTFRARITLAVALIVIAMMAALIVTQNLIVSHTAQRDGGDIVMCVNADGTTTVTTGSAAESVDGDAAVSCFTGDGSQLRSGSDADSYTWVPYGTGDDGKTSDDSKTPWSYTDIVTGTADAVADNFVSTMRVVSIVETVVFGLLAVAAAWIIGTMLSRRVTAVERQIAALPPNDLSARVNVREGHDDIDRLVSSVNKMLNRVEAAAETERRFVSNASHELRTPIAAVETNLDAPLSQGRFPDDVEPSVRRALAANRRGAKLVDALLTLSRIQSGAYARTGENESSFRAGDGTADVMSCLHDAVDRSTEDANDRGVTMTIADSDEFRVTANPALLSLAVDNLVRNAVVHNVDGGSATIETGNDGDGTLHLVIENTTDGTLPDDLDELVQPFHRGTDSRISAADGVGLGLSIADAACNAMGAELRLSRTDDGGFRATIAGLHTV